VTLVLQGVSKRFSGLLAVSDVSMTIPRHQVTGLIGPNGAGKTTLVNLITGTLDLSDGQIAIDGVSIGERSPVAVARHGISRTFQNIRIMAEATVLDNVMIGFHRHETAGLLSGLLALPAALRETRDLTDKAMGLLERFGMVRLANYPAGALAYGHQRRVEMMRAIASGPKILLLDEPVAGMNDVEAGELGEIFADLAAQGLGLLLIEHNIRFVTRMCPHVYVLDTGRIIADGPPSKVMRDEAVVTAYLGGH
jgi:branched-chain amino acid transport system ATP-binding protein